MTTKKRALDVQEGGNHYKKMPIQPVEYCYHNKLGVCESNIIKYVTRWRDKNGIQDLEKARHYIDLLIEFAQAEQVTGSDQQVKNSATTIDGMAKQYRDLEKPETWKVGDYAETLTFENKYAGLITEINNGKDGEFLMLIGSINILLHHSRFSSVEARS